MHPPLLEIAAGPDGSGKSTFAESFLADWILVDNSGRLPEFRFSKSEYDELDEFQKRSFSQNFLKGKVVV